MRTILSFCTAFLLLCALSVSAQRGPTRAEIECLALSRSSRSVLPGKPELFPSFHHVWTPRLSYGRFKSHGLDLLYEVEGSGNETLLVVHGGPGLPHDYFHPALSNLSKHVRLIYFDRRADMLSHKDPHSPLMIEEMADDIEALRLALELDKLNLFAHSFGCVVAINYAERYPERVERLILTGASPGLEDPAAIEQRLLRELRPGDRAAYSGEGTTGSVSPCDRVKLRYRLLFPHYFHKVPDVGTLDRNSYHAYFDMLARKLAVSSDTRVLASHRSEGIGTPTLILAGKHDRVTPLERAQSLAQSLPASKLVVMEHSGHFAFVEESYLFTAWVRAFLTSSGEPLPEPAARTGVAGSGQ